MIENNSNKRKATIKDVATHAGVSISTVSHVMNGSAPISADTKTKVKNSIETLNYSPNAMARGLRQNKSKIIGIVVPDISNMFYAKCASGFIQAAAKKNNTVSLINTNYDIKVEKKSVVALIERRVDGLVFFGGFDDKIIEIVKKADIPVVLGDRCLSDVSSIVFNNEGTMRSLVSRLKNFGFDKIGYISEPPNMINLKKRYDGFLGGIKEECLSLNDDYVIFDKRLQKDKIKCAEIVILEWVQKNISNLPQVFLTSSDYIAIGVINGLEKSGLKVPKDIGVVGFDDVDAAEIFSPSLTTIRQDAVLLGEKCFELLYNQMKDKNNVSNEIIIDTELVLRDSLKLEDALCMSKN